MSQSPDLDDLRLVVAITDERSISAAARLLGVSQPSASQRLALIERRCGATLFDRDTTGARPTAAGSEMARLGTHILQHVERVYPASVSASGRVALAVGTFTSLAASVFVALDELVAAPVTPTVDHGPRLIEAVAEGALDAAVVAVAEQVRLPQGVQVHPIGDDRLGILRTAGQPGIGRGTRPLAGRRVVYSTYDSHGPQLRERLERLGASAHEGPTLATTIGMARWRDCLGVVPRSTLAHEMRDGDSLDSLPFGARVRLSLVTGRGGCEPVVAALPQLRRWMHLLPHHDADGQRPGR